VRGPRKDYVVRRKEEVGGLWVNRDRMKFLNVPDFYAIASSRPMTAIEQFAVSRQLGIGQDSLLAPPPDPRSQPTYAEFADAFLRHQYGRRLYMKDSGDIQFMAETLFKTAIEFPDDIPPGHYTAEVYLLSGGEVVGMQSMPITVDKGGIDEFLYRA